MFIDRLQLETQRLKAVQRRKLSVQTKWFKDLFVEKENDILLNDIFGDISLVSILQIVMI